MKNRSEETNLAENSTLKRDPKPLPLSKQNIILHHKLKMQNLKSDSEKFAYEASRAAAEIFVQPKCDTRATRDNETAAEDVLNVTYGLMEVGRITLAQANQIVSELKKTLMKRNEQLRQKLKIPRLPK